MVDSDEGSGEDFDPDADSPSSEDEGVRDEREKHNAGERFGEMLVDMYLDNAPNDGDFNVHSFALGVRCRMCCVC